MDRTLHDDYVTLFVPQEVEGSTALERRNKSNATVAPSGSTVVNSNKFMYQGGP